MRETGFTVVVRIRPYNGREAQTTNDPLLTVVDEKTVLFDPKRPGTKKRFLMGKERRKSWYARFDRLFDGMSTQQDIYEATARLILDDVLDGYNATVFAYGATGSGKTYSMVGSLKEPGVMVRSVNELFKRIQLRKHMKYSISISYLEIYNEEIRDLLAKKKTGKLELRQTKQGVMVANISCRTPRLASQVLQWLEEGNKLRTKCKTDLNNESSRSHAVLQINIRGKDPTNDTEVYSKLSLIDLAGSEKGQKKHCQRIAKEGANINRSLLALGNCITALVKNATSNRKHHIPFRDSKLTLLLKDSLGGNCRSVMIAAVSPSRLSYEDTYNTLKYADCFKQIKVKMKSNRRSIPQDFSNYKKQLEEKNDLIAELKAEIEMLRGTREEESKQRMVIEEELVPEFKRKADLEEQIFSTKIKQVRVRFQVEEAGSPDRPRRLRMDLQNCKRRIEHSLHHKSKNLSNIHRELLKRHAERLSKDMENKLLRSRIQRMQCDLIRINSDVQALPSSNENLQLKKSTSVVVKQYETNPDAPMRLGIISSPIRSEISPPKSPDPVCENNAWGPLSNPRQSRHFTPCPQTSSRNVSINNQNLQKGKKRKRIDDLLESNIQDSKRKSWRRKNGRLRRMSFPEQAPKVISWFPSNVGRPGDLQSPCIQSFEARERGCLLSQTQSSPFPQADFIGKKSSPTQETSMDTHTLAQEKNSKLPDVHNLSNVKSSSNLVARALLSRNWKKPKGQPQKWKPASNLFTPSNHSLQSQIKTKRLMSPNGWNNFQTSFSNLEELQKGLDNITPGRIPRSEILRVQHTTTESSVVQREVKVLSRPSAQLQMMKPQSWMASGNWV